MHTVKGQFSGNIQLLAAATEEFFANSAFERSPNRSCIPEYRMDYRFLRMFEVAGIKYEDEFGITGVLRKDGQSIFTLRSESEDLFKRYKQMFHDYRGYLVEISG